MSGSDFSSSLRRRRLLQRGEFGLEGKISRRGQHPQLDVTTGTVIDWGDLVVENEGWKTVRSLVGNPQPLTWVFTGEDVLDCGHFSTGEWGFFEWTRSWIRNDLGRAQDVCINTGMGNSRLEQLGLQWTWRVARFQPEVVVLSVGRSDTQGGLRGNLRFSDLFQRLLERCRASGLVPLILIPALPYADSLDYTHAQRHLTSEMDLPVLDLGALWHQACPRQEDYAQWCEPGTQAWNPAAHRLMAQWFQQALLAADAE